MKKLALLEALKKYFFTVKPIGSIDAVSNEYGWFYPWMTDKNMKLRDNLPTADIQLIKASGSQDEALKYIVSLGHRPAESEYLLGFGQTYHSLLSKYRFAVALDRSAELRGNNGFRGSICIDWHDEPELRLLNENKILGQSWWVPVHTTTNTLPNPLELFEKKVIRPAFAEDPLKKFKEWENNYGVIILVDEAIELILYHKGYYGVEAKRFSCFKTPSTGKVTDYQFMEQTTLSSVEDILATAEWLISEDMMYYHRGEKNWKSVLRNLVATGQENLNLGYYDDGIGIKVVFLECKEAGKEYHIHENYIPRLYKPNRFMLIEDEEQFP